MVFVAKLAKRLSKVGWVCKAFLLIFWGGCATDTSQQAQEKPSEVDTLYTVSWEELEVYMKAAPSPAQVSLWLRTEKVPFYRDILHDAALASRYRGLRAAANLGVYLTDMAYAHATQQYQTAYEYLTSANQLARLYGVEELLSVERIRQLDKLQDNPDSLQKLFSQYYANIQNRLQETGQQASLRHIILGSWLEGLHITLSILKRQPDRKGLSDAITLQKTLIPLLEKLYAADSAYSQESKEVLVYLLQIRTELASTLSDGVAGVSPQASAKGGVIRLEAKSPVSISKERLNAVAEKVTDMRNYLIQS